MCIRDRGGTEQIELEPVTARYVELAGISRATPVSYTHLDVYKRQGIMPKIKEIIPEFKC